jgi:ABC-type transporter Mla MlaB component
MLRIQRKANTKVIFVLSGRIEAEDIDELQRLFELEDTSRKIALDLRDVTLVDRAGVNFLAVCERNSIQLENCPAYIREWIGRENGKKRRHKQVNDSDGQNSSKGARQ